MKYRSFGGDALKVSKGLGHLAPALSGATSGFDATEEVLTAAVESGVAFSTPPTSTAWVKVKRDRQFLKSLARCKNITVAASSAGSPSPVGPQLLFEAFRQHTDASLRAPWRRGA